MKTRAPIPTPSTLALLHCPSCGGEAPATSGRFTCACGDLYDVAHAFRRPTARTFDKRLGKRNHPFQSGVWRFRELIYPRFPSDAIVSLNEGNTPIYRAHTVSTFVGADDLWLKHEGMNPTGSFKDRGMTVAVSRAAASKARWLACASTGNTAASLAAYSAAAGLSALIVVPERSTALGKLSQAIAYGARVVQVRGDFDVGMKLVRGLAEDGSIYLLNSINPFRIEGQKSIVLDLLQQLGWKAPEWIVFPAGNLGNCAAFGKALAEAKALGLIESTPRLAAIQASGANPFARAYRAGFPALEALEAETVATAIRIGNPVSYARAVRSIQETRGVVGEVTDAEILEAKAVVDAAGIGAEPASCAALAGVKRLVSEGTIQPWDRVVCILTGHLLKDPDTTLAFHRGAVPGVESSRVNPPVTIDPSADDLRSALGL